MPLHLELGSDWGWMLFSSFNFISMPCRSKQSSSACPGFGHLLGGPGDMGQPAWPGCDPGGSALSIEPLGNRTTPSPGFQTPVVNVEGSRGEPCHRGCAVSQPWGHLSGSPCGRICWQLGGGWGSRPCLHAPHHMDEVKGGEEEEALPPHSRCCSEGACAQGTRAP